MSGQSAQVEIRFEDVMRLPGDVLVIPSTTAGGYGAPWRGIVDQLGLPRRPGRIGHGQIELVELPARGRFAFLAFAATVDGRSASSATVIEQVGHALGRVTVSHSARVIVSPLLGTGVGKLDVDIAFESLLVGFRATALPESRLVVCEVDARRYEVLRSTHARWAERTDAPNAPDLPGNRPTVKGGGEVQDSSAAPLGAGTTAQTAPAAAAEWAALGDEARDVLRLAHAVRRTLNSSRVHSEHLAWALSRGRFPTVPERWHAVDLPELRSIDAGVGEQLVERPLPTLARMPRLSTHVETALGIAASRAPAAGVVSAGDIAEGVLAVPECSIARKLSERLRDRGSVLARPVGDTVPDRLVRREDRLDLRREVEMMATVAAAHQTPMPLAIGLFGAWGSGKSFFMAMMRERVAELEDLAKKGRPEAEEFCAHVRQIEFNAWHYVDGDLWASLASTIFDGLVKEPEPSVHSAKAEELGKAKQTAVTAAERVTEAEQQLRLARRTSEGVSRTVRASVPAALEAVRSLPDIEGQLGSLGAEFTPGVPAERVLAAVEDASTLARQVTLFLGLVRSELLNPHHRRQFIATAAVVVVIVVAVVLVGQLGLWESILAVLAAVGAIASPALRGATVILTRAREVRRKREQPIRQAELDLAEARRHLQLAEQELQAREQELARLRNRGEQLHELVRSARSAYGSRLSMMSQLRKDFEQLAWLLGTDPVGSSKGDAGGASDAPREEIRRAAGEVVKIGGADSDTLDVERIILYIDDLDRCPAKQVVEVLQAINLLLAFRLFVVVIGVDGRWLEASLRAQHKDLLVSPRDYLEKIIQIPFVLRPMDGDAFGSLVSSLVDVSEESRGESPPSDSRAPTPDAAPPAGKGAADVPDAPRARRVEDDPPDDDSTEEATGGAPGRHSDEPARDTVMPRPESLVITKEERDWLARVGELVATPRTTKRLVNTYRMLRVCADAGESSDFGSGDRPHEYRVVILLLAVMLGCPDDAERLFASVEQAEASASLDSVLRPVAGDRLADRLLTLQDAEDAFTAETYQKWLPSVRRFSYRLGAGQPTPATPSLADARAAVNG